MTEYEKSKIRLTQLFSLPVIDPERPKLRDRVPIENDRLHAKCRKFLTLGKEYAERETFRRQMDNPPANVYPAWCKPTVQRKPLPFETYGCLPGMEAFAAQFPKHLMAPHAKRMGWD